jgi:hypothetical protein
MMNIMNMLGKDLERARQRMEAPSSLKKIASFFFVLSYCLLAIDMFDMFTECVFLELDTEYRYWSFMEAHPAHNSLPAKAKLEAMDVLTWAWTGKMAFFYSAPQFAQTFTFFLFHRASPSFS